MRNRSWVGLVVGGLWLAPTLAAAGGPPLQPRWRPVAAPAHVAPDPPFVLPRFVAAEAEGGQIAFVDPVSGTLLPGPAPERGVRTDFVQRDAPPRLQARRSPAGFLYIEVEGMHETLTATLDGSGRPRLRCVDPAHVHDALAPTAEPQP